LHDPLSVAFKLAEERFDWGEHSARIGHSSQLKVPANHPDWLFELKADGFRGLLYIDHGKGWLISRNARAMKRFGALAWTRCR